MSAKLNILSDTEKAVVQTLVMRLQPTEALAYLKDCGIKMAGRSHFRYKKKVEAMKWQRLKHAGQLIHRTALTKTG